MHFNIGVKMHLLNLMECLPFQFGIREKEQF